MTSGRWFSQNLRGAGASNGSIGENCRAIQPATGLPERWLNPLRRYALTRAGVVLPACPLSFETLRRLTRLWSTNRGSSSSTRSPKPDALAASAERDSPGRRQLPPRRPGRLSKRRLARPGSVEIGSCALAGVALPVHGNDGPCPILIMGPARASVHQLPFTRVYWLEKWPNRELDCFARPPLVGIIALKRTLFPGPATCPVAAGPCHIAAFHTLGRSATGLIPKRAANATLVEVSFSEAARSGRPRLAELREQ